MSSRHALVLWLAVASCLACPALSRAGPANPDIPASSWQLSDFVLIKATAYPADAGRKPGDPPPPAGDAGVSFELHVGVMNPLPLDQIPVPAWRVQFNPRPAVPPYKDIYRIWVGKEDGWMRKFARDPDWKGTTLNAQAGAPFPFDPPAWVPLELFPLVDSAVLKTPDGAATVTISKQAEGNAIWMTVIVRQGDKETLKIRQHWKPGAKWWTDYERYRDGRKELVAHAGPAIDPPPPPKPLPPRTDLPPVSGLASDERLRVPIDLDMDHKPLHDLLDVLSQKTGARLSLDTPLALQRPMFSSYSFRNVPAHQVMDQIAFYSVVEGRWEKTDDGYCLHAVRAVDPGRTERPEPLSPTTRLILCIAPLPFLFAWGIYYVVRRFRKKPAGASPDVGERGA